MSIKQYTPVKVSDLARNVSKYIKLAEQGEIIYVIKNSMIVAKICKVEFKGEIQ